MAKLSQSAVKQKADDWAVLKGKIGKAETALNRELEPFIERHNEEIKPVLEKHEAKIAKLVDAANVIEAEVFEYLAAQAKDVVLAGSLAVAERKTETKIGSRVIDVSKFLEAAKSHGAKMWECVTVAIKKAEDLIGKKEVDAIASKPTTATVTNTLKLK